jgi:hypothetical protein
MSSVSERRAVKSLPAISRNEVAVNPADIDTSHCPLSL